MKKVWERNSEENLSYGRRWGMLAKVLRGAGRNKWNKARFMDGGKFNSTIVIFMKIVWFSVIKDISK